MYDISKLVIALISPLGSVLALGGASLLLAALARGRAARMFAGVLGLVACGWLCLWSLPASSDWLRSWIESDFPPVPVGVLPAAQAIVVLGGAMSPPEAGRPLPDLGAAADRVWHAARLYHAGKAPILLLSGGRNPEMSRTSEAESMRLFLSDLGVPDAAMLLENASRNTRENARFSAALLRERGIRRVLLVTSALHMRRALALFRAEGLEVIPAATDHEHSGQTGWLRFVPDSWALDSSARAMKEWVGQRY